MNQKLGVAHPGGLNQYTCYSHEALEYRGFSFIFRRVVLLQFRGDLKLRTWMPGFVNDGNINSNLFIKAL